MKKVISILMAITMIFSLAACGKTPTNENNEADSAANESVQKSTETVEIPNEDGKILIAYFSWSGNTEEMASYIQEKTKGDLFEIEPVNPYPTDYEDVVMSLWWSVMEMPAPKLQICWIPLKNMTQSLSVIQSGGIRLL